MGLKGNSDNVIERSIGREIKVYRTKIGLTITELAKLVDLSSSMLSKIENGVTYHSILHYKTICFDSLYFGAHRNMVWIC